MTHAIIEDVRRPTRAQDARRIAVAVSDRDLGNALHTALLLRPDLRGVAEAEADVIITDRSTPGDGRAKVLMAGRAAIPEADTTIDSRDPHVLLGAALLLASGYAVTKVRRPSARLTGREAAVVSLLVEGASNKAIARALDISVHTAKFHVNTLFDKLGARNRTDAVCIALRDGLVKL